MKIIQDNCERITIECSKCHSLLEVIPNEIFYKTGERLTSFYNKTYFTTVKIPYILECPCCRGSRPKIKIIKTDRHE